MIQFILEYWQWLAIGVPAVIGLGVACYLLRNWRYGAAALVIGVSILAVLRAFSRGQQAEREENQKAVDKAVQQRKKVDARVDRLPPDARRDRLREWTRD